MVDIEQVKKAIGSKPKYVEENDDGTFTIHLRHNTDKITNNKVIMEEQTGEVLESVEKMAEKTGTSYEMLLARRSIIEPQLSDEDLLKLKGSDYTRVKLGVLYVYDMSSLFQ